jgi:uncharacterized protein YukE
VSDTGYSDYSDRTSVAGSLKQSAEDAPLVGNVMSAVSDASSGDIGALGADIGNFVMGAQGAIEDPLNALISAGLSFLMDVIQPLRDCLQQVTGDAGALDDAKEQFEDIGKDIEQLAGDLDDITKTGFQNWQGDAKNAAGQQVATFVQGVEGTAGNADDVAQVLGMSAMLMEGAYNIVLGIIADCIEWLIVTWVAALAAEVPTCGASTAAAGAATTGEVAAEGANAGDKVEQATSFVERITQIFQKLISKLKDLEKAAGEGEKAASETEKAASETEKAASGGEKAATETESAAGHTEQAAAHEGGGESGGGESGGSGGESGGGEGGGGGGHEGGSGEGGSGEGGSNENKSLWGKVKDNWNEQFEGQKGSEAKTLGHYLTDHETNPDGSQGLNKIQDVLVDPLKEDAFKISGNLFDQATDPGPAPQSDEQIDQELQG